MKNILTSTIREAIGEIKGADLEGFARRIELNQKEEDVIDYCEWFNYETDYSDIDFN